MNISKKRVLVVPCHEFYIDGRFVDLHGKREQAFLLAKGGRSSSFSNVAEIHDATC